eukprot:scaffold995_cov358-Pavlova_lutheri.AAC.13
MLDCQGPIGSIRPTGTPKFDRATFPFEDQQGDSGWERPGEGMAHVPSKCRQPTHGGMESPPIPWIGKEIPFRKEGQDPSGSIERPGSRDPSVGVSSLLGEETLSCRQAGTTVPNGPAGAGLSIGRTNATSDT